MVSKSLTFVAFLLCSILAQTAAESKYEIYTRSVSDAEDSSDHEDESDVENSEDEEEPFYPSLSCLLFKDVGCNSECSVMGSAFGYKATGTCGEEDNVCDCAATIPGGDSLGTLWKAKFDSKDILKEIEKDENLSEQVYDILQDPFQTAQEVKDQLKSVLSKDQVDKLQLKEDSDAAKMTKKGKSNQTAIKEYIADKLPATLKSSASKKISALNYKSNLIEAFKKAKEEDDAFNELVSDVRRTKNKSLGDILTEYLKKNKLKEPTESKNEPSVADTIADYVIDELVKHVSTKKPTSNKKSPAKKPAKKPVKKPVQKTKSKKSKDDDDSDDDEDDDANASDVALQKDRFKLKNFDKSIFKHSGPINQNWSRNGYNVQYQRSWGGSIDVFWKKGVDEVRIQKSAGGSVSQNWKFGNVAIQLSESAGGSINENWNFEKNAYQYSKSAGGSINLNWSSGKSDNKTLKKYRRFIDAWCQDNDFFLDRGSCIIYNV